MTCVTKFNAQYTELAQNWSPEKLSRLRAIADKTSPQKRITLRKRNYPSILATDIPGASRNGKRKINAQQIIFNSA